MKGKLIQINVKNKSADGIGLPKIPVASVKVTKSGLDGDYNNYRMDHKAGTLDRAILLMSQEKLDEINQEGWAIKPGDIGENFLIQGIIYDKINIGDRFKIGDAVKIEIREKCNPCKVLANLNYVGQEKIKQFIQTMKNRRGWYAKVLLEGRVMQGDEIVKVDN